MRARIFMVLRIFGGIAIVTYASLLIYIASYIDATSSTPADAAIVLGAQSYQGAEVNPCLISRVEGAALLYHKRTVRKIIVSGGDDRGGLSNESRTMTQVAVQNNIPARDIIAEPKATSTYENILFSRNMMPDLDVHSVIIVSEPFHIARARLVARSLDIDAQYRAVQSPCWNEWRYLSWSFLREPVAIVYYALLGRIRMNAF